MSYQGLLLTNAGDGSAAFFAAPGSLPAAGTTATTILPALGPTLQPDTAVNMLDSNTGGAVRVDNGSSAAYVGGGNGSSLPEQFCAYDPSNPARTSPFVPGSTVVLRSKVSRLRWTSRCPLQDAAAASRPGTHAAARTWS